MSLPQHELVISESAWLSYWGLSVHGKGKGMILTQSKWVFWPSVSSLHGLYRFAQYLSKFLAPWVLPDPYEKPNTISLWKEPLAYLESFSGPLKKSSPTFVGLQHFPISPSWQAGSASLKNSLLPKSFAFSAYLSVHLASFENERFNSLLTSVASRNQACPSS